MSLDKILRLSGQQGQAGSPSSGDELRELARAVHLALSEATATDDPQYAAGLVAAAAVAAEGLSGMLFAEGMSDWVEATAGPSAADLALSGSAPYGDVDYADPGYQADGKKRYPLDTEDHVRAANSYIAMAKNAKAYSAGQLAKIKGKIQGAMKKHGIGSNVAASGTPVLTQLVDGSAWVALAGAAPAPQGIPMHHAPFNGTHAHAHAVTMTHEHEHTHVGDSNHGGSVHGSNAGQKAWAAKGEATWAAHRREY